MDVAHLFGIQKELDEKITQKHKLYGVKLLPQKILALQVELGELANETRCFKFWSIKPASSKDVILEEYVDALHFVLSIGLEAGFRDQVRLNTSGTDRERDLTEAFLAVFDRIAAFAQKQDLAAYLAMFEALLDLGEALGFSWDEIEQAYLRKNEVNHLRQESGY